MEEKSPEKLIELLVQAENASNLLKTENENLSQAYYGLLDAQKQETEQMVQLMEQVWALEEALSKSQEEALAQFNKFKERFVSLHEQMKEALAVAETNPDGLELAARVYEMSQAAEPYDLDAEMKAFNERLLQGKDADSK